MQTQILLGTDFKTARAHIESLFEEGMTWDNWSVNGWHIDHIIPFSKGGNSTWRNLQILCESCNLKKSNKIG